MIFTRQLHPRWPKLAWAAVCPGGSSELLVHHGPMIECFDKWIAEAAWAGSFADGDFDRTDLVFGTGIRIRDSHAVIVPSGTTFDRILYCQCGDVWYFSNSLPAILAVAKLSLRDDYFAYTSDAGSITRGLQERVSTIPTKTYDVKSVVFNNLIFDGHTVIETTKPDTSPHFRTYHDYKAFLVATARQLGENIHSPERKHAIIPVSSISSGYDSCVAAVVSQYLGCTETVTIKGSTSFWRGSDSGLPVAKRLGMNCTEYHRTATCYPEEASVWAASGRPGILNWTLFDYREPLCLFFTGCHGEKMWDRVMHDHVDPFVRRNEASLGFCEYRLIRGVFQCVVPFWGVRHSDEMRTITASEEMRPWYAGKDYDKPIARRLLDEAGVPGNLFGKLKKNSSHEASFLWPYSRNAQESLAHCLSARKCFVPGRFLVHLMRKASHLENLLYWNIQKKMGVRTRFRPWNRLEGQRMIFQWANETLKQQYASGLEETVRQDDPWSLLAMPSHRARQSSPTPPVFRRPTQQQTLQHLVKHPNGEHSAVASRMSHHRFERHAL